MLYAIDAGHRLLPETAAPFSLLRQAAEPAAAAPVERLVPHGADRAPTNQRARLRPGEGLDEDEAVAARGSEDLVQKIGLHEGPCLAASLNARQNDFGPTVNIASHMQGPAERR